MKRISADRLFFYLLLFLVTIVTLILIWPYIGSVVLAITVAVVLQPMHVWFLKRAGGRKGPATALTLITTLVLVVIPVLIGAFLLLDTFAAVSNDVTRAVQQQQSVLAGQAGKIDQWLSSIGLADRLQLESDEVSQTVHNFVNGAGLTAVRWLASAGASVFNLIVPMILFVSLLGTLLANSHRSVQVLKMLSPLDDNIDQLFLDRLRIMTKAMMLSIVVVAVVQGVVTGLLMALGGTPHVVPLTILAIILSIVPGGAAIVAVPVGLVHMMNGEMWAGLLIIVGTITLVAGLDNQVRPLLVSKDAYLNRAFVLLSVFSGIALFGFMGIVYGPIIMILCTTTLEVYLTYYRPGPPEVTPNIPDVKSAIEQAAEELDQV